MIAKKIPFFLSSSLLTLVLGLLVEGARGTGLEAPGLEVMGLEVPGLEVPGLEAPGLEVIGLEELQAGGFKEEPGMEGILRISSSRITLPCNF